MDGQKMLDVGDLEMPLLLVDQLDVFVDSESIHNNDCSNLIADKF